MKRPLIVALFAVAFLSAGCDPKTVAIEVLMSSENHKSMDFYGKIVDQDNHPVEGVRVTAGVGTYEGPTRSGGQKYYTVSDAEGLFSFTGIHGAGCGYILEKDGYAFDQRQPFASRPKDYVPDQNKPALFAMWRLQGANPMAHTAFDSRVAYDGQTTAFDLISGRKAEGGDLRITLARNPLRVRRGREFFDWSVKIQVAGGALVANSDLYPYEAPETGYASTFDISVSKDAPNWTQRLTKAYYFRTARGEYGRMNIDLTTDSERPEGTGISIAAWINPSGSRNLEWDPAKQVNR
jgi:hypothetical protein